MLTRAQLEEIQLKMDEEHRLDREALSRLWRFVSENGTGLHHEADTSVSSTVALSFSSPTVLGRLEVILRENSNRTWTAQQLRTELLRKGFDLKAKNPIATIGVALKKLTDRGKIYVVIRGSGREPNVYQWQKAKIGECEVLEEKD